MSIDLTLKNIQALAATTKRLEKEAIISKAWYEGDHYLFPLAKLCYDPFTTFGVADKMVPVSTLTSCRKTPAGLVGDTHPLSTPEDFIALANDLSSRKFTGNAAKDEIYKMMCLTSMDVWNNIYRPVLLKDLRTGCTDNTFNKVIEKLIKEAPTLEKFRSRPDDTYVDRLKACLIPTFDVQLAKDGGEETFEGKIILQEKLDGVRLMTVCDIENKKVTHYTRNGKENTNFPHITQVFEDMLPNLKESMVFDGEVIGVDFQSLMTQVNRKDNVSSKNTCLALFDCLLLSEFKNLISQTPQLQRIEMLEKFSQFSSNNSVYVVSSLHIDMTEPNGAETFAAFNKKALDAGKEGIMIKDPTAPYECKRSKAWLKMKPFIEESLSVVDLEEGTGKYAGKLGNLLCAGEANGKKIEVSVGSGFSDEDRAEIWGNRDKMIGMIAEVRADCLTKNRDSDEVWSMRFPRFKGFRGSKPGEKL